MDELIHIDLGNTDAKTVLDILSKHNLLQNEQVRDIALSSYSIKGSTAQEMWEDYKNNVMYFSDIDFTNVFNKNMLPENEMREFVKLFDTAVKQDNRDLIGLIRWSSVAPTEHIAGKNYYGQRIIKHLHYEQVVFDRLASIALTSYQKAMHIPNFMETIVAKEFFHTDTAFMMRKPLRMVFFKPFWDKLNEMGKLFILSHEAQHLYRLHHSRFAKHNQQRIANIAMDIVINDDLKTKFQQIFKILGLNDFSVEKLFLAEPHMPCAGLLFKQSDPYYDLFTQWAKATDIGEEEIYVLLQKLFEEQHKLELQNNSQSQSVSTILTPANSNGNGDSRAHNESNDRVQPSKTEAQEQAQQRSKSQDDTNSGSDLNGNDAKQETIANGNGNNGGDKGNGHDHAQSSEAQEQQPSESQDDTDADNDVNSDGEAEQETAENKCKPSLSIDPKTGQVHLKNVKLSSWKDHFVYQVQNDVKDGNQISAGLVETIKSQLDSLKRIYGDYAKDIIDALHDYMRKMGMAKDSDERSNMEGLDQKQMEQIVSELRNMSKMYGNTSFDIDQIIKRDQEYQSKVLPFSIILKQMVKKKSDNGSWEKSKQLNRIGELSRYPDINSQMGYDCQIKLYRKQRMQTEFHILAIWDTSASMGMKEQQWVLAQVRDLILKHNVFLHIVPADTEVKAAKKITLSKQNWTQIEANGLTLSGGGGTDMFNPLAYELANWEHHYDIAMIMSDGFYYSFTKDELVNRIMHYRNEEGVGSQLSRHELREWQNMFYKHGTPPLLLLHTNLWSSEDAEKLNTFNRRAKEFLLNSNDVIKM